MFAVEFRWKTNVLLVLWYIQTSIKFKPPRTLSLLSFILFMTFLYLHRKCLIKIIVWNDFEVEDGPVIEGIVTLHSKGNKSDFKV